MENNVYFKPNQQSHACFSSAMSGTNGRRPLGKAKGNMKIKTLLLLFIALLPSAMRAYVDVGNLYYTLDEYYKFAEVWGYGNIPEDGNIDIPASIYYEGQSYIVTSISSGAF